MEYTEIPTHLLCEATNLLPRLGYLFEQGEYDGDIELIVTEKQMRSLLPLIKWLEYVEAEWSADHLCTCKCGNVSHISTA